MSHCPQCLAEYREGFTHCPDCDLDLVPGGGVVQVAEGDVEKARAIITSGLEEEATE